MTQRIRAILSVALLFLVFGGALNTQSDVVYASNGRVVNQRQMSYPNNRPLIDGDWYWTSSRVREWLHSTSTNPRFTNRGTVTRRTRGFLSDFTTAERNQIAVTRRQTPVRHEWEGGLTTAERTGSTNFHGDDGLAAMRPYSMRYQGHPSGNGDPMVHRNWRATITHDKVFIPNAWELQRYVESRGWSMARGNTDGEGDTDTGYWIGGTQTYTFNVSRGLLVTADGRVTHGIIRSNNSGIVPMLHLKPDAAAGVGKRIGDTLTFGRYNSDNPEGHRGAITWRVVNEVNGYKLLMAEHAVDHFTYNVQPGGDPNNAVFAKSNYVNFNSFDIDIVDDLLFQNTDANGTYISGAPEQPWFRILNTNEFYRRNTIGAEFRITGREVSGRSINRMWLGGNFVSGRFNRGSQTTSGAGPITYRLLANDPGGRNTVITLQNDRNVFMSGHLPFNMIDEHVHLDVRYNLPYNGYAANNQYVDIDVGLSNWDVNRTIPRWQGRIPGQGELAVFIPPNHTTYAGTRYRMSGRIRVTDWGGMHQALSAEQWDTQGLVHRTYSTVLDQPAYLYDMYLPSASYNSVGSALSSRGPHGYDGSVGAVDEAFFMPWSRLRDAGGAGWVNFDTVMPVPQTWLAFTGDGLGFHATPNVRTDGYQFPIVEIENWEFELIDDAMFTLDWLRLPNNQTINNPPVGSMHRHRVTATGDYSFVARDSRGYDWHATANVRIDKKVPTGTVTQSPTAPTNGNVTLTLDSRDNESGLASVEYISGGTVQSQSVPSINQNDFVQTHRSTFTVSQNGTYRFRLTDRAGNVREVTHTVGNIDRTPPTTDVSQTPTDWTNQDVTVNWTAHAQGLSDLRRVRFDEGSGWSSWMTASGRTQSFNRTVSSNRTVRFEVEDVAGNVASQSHVVNNIDKEDPALTVLHYPNTWTNQNVTSTFSSRDYGSSSRIAGVHRLRIRAENGTWSEWTTYGNETELSESWFEQTRTITSNGTYEAQVEDRAGNRRSRTFTVDWIDRTGPIASTRLNPNSWTNQNVDIIVLGEDVNNEGSRISGVDRIRMRRAGASSWMETQHISESTEDSPTFNDRTFTVTENGTYEFELRDRAGNITIVRQAVERIDRTPPIASGSFVPDGWTNQDITITWVAERAGTPPSPLRRYRTHDGTSWSAWQNAQDPVRISVNQVVASNGVYRFQVQDEAGNIQNAQVEVTQYDDVAPVGNIRARFDRTEQEVFDGSVEDVTMIDQERVTVEVFDVEDLGISGVEFVEIEEQRRTGSIHSATGSSIDEWQTVETYRYDWPDPYDVSEQTYQIDVSHALDTRFVLIVQDRAGNRSEHAVSNDVRHSVLQFKDFRITNVVNPALTQDEVDDLRNIDLTTGTAPVTAGTNVTFDLTYALSHLDAVESIEGVVKVHLVDPTDNRIVHTAEISMSDGTTGHNRDRTITGTFTVPARAERGFFIAIDGTLTAELANGTQHTITYPNTDSVGFVDNHLEEFFRFRIVQ